MVEAVQRWRIAFRRGSPALDLGPSETARAWEAGLAESGIPVVMSAAATPRTRLTFAAPLPAGRAAEHDLADLVLSERWRLARVRPALVAALPVGFELVDLYDVWVGAPSITAALGATGYRASVGGAPSADLTGAADRLLAAPMLKRIRAKADRAVPYDLRPLILDLAVSATDPEAVPNGPSGATLRMVLRTSVDGPSGRPDEVLLAMGEILGCQLEQLDLVRERQWTSDEVPRLGGGPTPEHPWASS
ncbi:MAG: TIGR03936 family radical SAM-associated protein [Candidatus Limnocylindrales bacterium]